MTQHVSSASPSTPLVGGPRLRAPRRVFVWGALAIFGCVATAIALTLSRPRDVSVPQPAVSLSGDRVDIAADAPTWRYIELAQASMGAPVAGAAVPGRVAVDEARSSSIVAPLPGRVDAVAVRLGQAVGQGDRLLSVRSAALVDLFREIDLIRAEETARTRSVERLRDLVRLKAAPEKDLISAEQDLRQTQLTRESAEMKLRSLSVAAANEGLYWVTAQRCGGGAQRPQWPTSGPGSRRSLARGGRAR